MIAQTEIDILTLLQDASGPTLMVVIIWGAIQEWWVPGRTHRRTVAERDELLKLAIRGTKAAEKVATAAEIIAGSESNE